jgi:hypothetical protein
MHKGPCTGLQLKGVLFLVQRPDPRKERIKVPYLGFRAGLEHGLDIVSPGQGNAYIGAEQGMTRSFKQVRPRTLSGGNVPRYFYAGDDLSLGVPER